MAKVAIISILINERENMASFGPKWQMNNKKFAQYS